MQIVEIMELIAEASKGGAWNGKHPNAMSAQIQAGDSGLEIILSAYRHRPEYGEECYWAVQLADDYATEADALRWGRDELSRQAWLQRHGVFEVKTFPTLNGWQAWCFFTDN